MIRLRSMAALPAFLVVVFASILLSTNQAEAQEREEDGKVGSWVVGGIVGGAVGGLILCPLASGSDTGCGLWMAVGALGGIGIADALDRANDPSDGHKVEDENVFFSEPFSSPLLRVEERRAPVHHGLDEKKWTEEESRTKEVVGALVGGVTLGLTSRAVLCSVDDTPDDCEDGLQVFLVGFAVGAILGAGIGSAL